MVSATNNITKYSTISVCGPGIPCLLSLHHPGGLNFKPRNFVSWETSSS